MRICPVGVKLFHMDGQTDIMKPTFNSCNFPNAPKYGFYKTTIIADKSVVPGHPTCSQTLH